MVQLFLLYEVLCYVFVVVKSNDGFGPGQWHVQQVKKCDEVNHKFMFNIGLKKINETQDGFFGSLILTELFDDHFGIQAEVSVKMDGGYKQVLVLKDLSAVNFVKKFAGNNINRILVEAGIDPPDFPLQEGNYEIEDYVFDYSELPKEFTYGCFSTKAYITENNEHVGCIEIQSAFQPTGESCE